MKTINPNIDIFDDFDKAMRAFNRCKVPCHLLQAFTLGGYAWFLDRELEALECWPDKYQKIIEK